MEPNRLGGYIKEQAKGVRGNKREALRDEIANNYAAENDFSEEQKEKLFDELNYPFEKRMRAFNQMKKESIGCTNILQQ